MVKTYYARWIGLSQSKVGVGAVKPDFSVDKVLCSMGSVGVVRARRISNWG